MKFLFSDYNLNIDLVENRITSICIENPTTFSDIIFEIFSQCQGRDGRIILSEKEKSFDLSKVAHISLNPFSLDTGTRLIKSRLLSELKDVSGESYEKFVDLESHIFEYIENVVSLLPYPINYKSSLDASDVFKLCDTEIDISGDSLCERLCNYTKILSSLCGIRVLFLVDIHKYLSDEEFDALIETAFYNKIDLIEIDSIERRYSYPANYYVIDADNCLITY